MSILNSTPTILISMPSGSEWLIVALVVILLFGARKIPDLARGLGKGIREFKEAKDGMKNEMEGTKKEEAESNDKA